MTSLMPPMTITGDALFGVLPLLGLRGTFWNCWLQLIADSLMWLACRRCQFKLCVRACWCVLVHAV